MSPSNRSPVHSQELLLLSVTQKVRAVSMDTVYPGWIVPPSRLFVLLITSHLSSSHTPFISLIPLDVIFY